MQLKNELAILKKEKFTHANWEQMELENKVCDALKELLAEEIKEEGDKGVSEEEIATKCGISAEEVRTILE